MHKNLIFLAIIAANWNKMCTFAPANSRRATLQEVGAATGREHYILRKVFANAMTLFALNVGNSNHKTETLQRWALRVGTIYAVPSGVPTAIHAVMHTFMGRNVYTNGVGVKSVCFLVRFPTT